jgi:hypothetical protein
MRDGRPRTRTHYPGKTCVDYPVPVDDTYTTAYSCELVRLGPGDHSVPHVEPWNHLLYFLSGSGDVTKFNLNAAVSLR